VYHQLVGGDVGRLPYPRHNFCTSYWHLLSSPSTGNHGTCAGRHRQHILGYLGSGGACCDDPRGGGRRLLLQFARDVEYFARRVDNGRCWWSDGGDYYIRLFGGPAHLGGGAQLIGRLGLVEVCLVGTAALGVDGSHVGEKYLGLCACFLHGPSLASRRLSPPLHEVVFVVAKNPMVVVIGGVLDGRLLS